MLLASYNLTPNEKKRYIVDYTDWLEVSETISTVSFVIQDVTVPPLVVSGNIIDISGKATGFFVNGGIDGQQYDVIIQIITSNTQVKEDHIIYNVKNA